jgi:hypothetical protein
MSLLDKYSKQSKDNLLKPQTAPTKYFDKIALMNKQASKMANRISSNTIAKVVKNETGLN